MKNEINCTLLGMIPVRIDKIHHAPGYFKMSFFQLILQIYSGFFLTHD